jgi:hypothetical protein
MVMFKAMVRHYGEPAQSMTDKPFRSRAKADLYCKEQYEIAKGYAKRYMILDNQYIILADDDTFATVYYVSK